MTTTATLFMEKIRHPGTPADDLMEKVHALEEMMRTLEESGIDLRRTHLPPTVEEECQNSYPAPINQQAAPFSWVAPYQR